MSALNSPRRALRRAVQIPCEVITRYLDEPLVYWATDLSPQGLWLETRFPMEAGEIVVVCFEPAIWWRTRPLMVFAEVARAARAEGGSGMGLTFLDLSTHEERALAAWLRGRPPPLPRRRPRSLGRRALPARRPMASLVI